MLVLAPECNPEGLTNPSIGYHHSKALARLHEVTLVLYASNETAVRRAGGPFLAIEPIRLPWLDRFYDWALRRIFKYDYGRQSLTAFSYPRHIAFELRTWRQLRHRIMSGEFDVVLRILPYNRVFPSPFAWLLRNGPIPFVIGPISGGLPWQHGFPQLQQQQEAPGYTMWKLRSVADHVPFAKSTFAKASAIIAGSSHTCEELAEHGEKLFFVPTEIGINSEFFEELPRSCEQGAKLELMFVGRLIPLKACDLALRSAAQLLRTGAAHFTIIGDGPERDRLRRLADSLGIAGTVTFAGWLPHSETLQRLRNADVLVFPSLREIGGGVVFEALAVGVVPVVADFGGPGDVVTSEIGYKIPLVDEADLTTRLQSVLQHLADDRPHLELLRQQGRAYAREHLTWDGKARVVSSVLLWTTKHGAKPNLRPPVRAVPCLQ